MKLAIVVVSLAAIAAILPCCTFARISMSNIPVFFSDPAAAPRKDPPGDPDAALAVLWVGHATALVQMHDKYVLTDPVFTETVGTLSRRLVAPGLDTAALPPVSVTLVSHRHFDHLSRDTFPLIATRLNTVLTPVGARDDIPEGPYAVAELAYGETIEVDGLRVTAMAVVHDGGRVLDGGSHPVAFTGYVVEYHGLTVYFPGDTAYRQDVFKTTRERFSNIDLALLPICPALPVDVMLEHHMDPEQALLAMHDLGAKQMVAIHFGTFINSYDDVGDCERAFDAAVAATDNESRAVRLAIGENRRLLGIEGTGRE